MSKTGLRGDNCNDGAVCQCNFGAPKNFFWHQLVEPSPEEDFDDEDDLEQSSHPPWFGRRRLFCRWCRQKMAATPTRLARNAEGSS